MGSGTPTLDTTIASKFASAHATMPMLATPDATVDDEEFLQKTLLTPWREATLDFDMYLAPASGHGVVIVSFVFVGNESVGASISFAVQANELQLAGMPTTDATSWMYGAAPYVPSTWTHIQLDVLPATSGGKIAISVGGSPVESWTGLSFSSDPSAELLELQLGMSRYGDDTNAVDVRYDNVVIRLLVIGERGVKWISAGPPVTSAGPPVTSAGPPVTSADRRWLPRERRWLPRERRWLRRERR